MNTIFRDIFRAIHEGKWLSIEYDNQEDQDTKYWIGIRDIDVRNRTMAVEGLHLARYTVEAFDKIKIDSIQSSRIIEGSFYPVNEKLVRDIYLNPHKYNTLFDNTANLKILSYLEMCNRMDAVPYISDFSLVRYLDHDNIQGEIYQLSPEQFQTIVKSFQYQAIIKMYQKDEVSVPIKAFFGDLLERPRRTGAYPITLINQRINMDQLLAIHNAMKYPIAYIQGPPGTGKTNTIINTIVTAFFNERTVLFSSYNNHPINGVYEKLSTMKYKGRIIPCKTV